MGSHNRREWCLGSPSEKFKVSRISVWFLAVFGDRGKTLFVVTIYRFIRRPKYFFSSKYCPLSGYNTDGRNSRPEQRVCNTEVSTSTFRQSSHSAAACFNEPRLGLHNCRRGLGPITKLHVSRILMGEGREDSSRGGSKGPPVRALDPK